MEKKTDIIEDRLQEYFNTCRQQGKKEVILTAGDVEKMFEVSTEIYGASKKQSRFPCICSVMRRVMKSGDDIVFEPQKGNGVKLEIRYNL